MGNQRDSARRKSRKKENSAIERADTVNLTPEKEH